MRRSADLTQKEIAERLGMQTSNYASFEKGRQETSARLQLQIAKFFKLKTIEEMEKLFQKEE
jgi:DNA-binding XRE family transcriptional regulator